MALGAGGARLPSPTSPTWLEARDSGSPRDWHGWQCPDLPLCLDSESSLEVPEEQLGLGFAWGQPVRPQWQQEGLGFVPLYGDR